MGIDALGRLIKISPDIAEQHQLAVIDCLEVSFFLISLRCNSELLFTYLEIAASRTCSGSVSLYFPLATSFLFPFSLHINSLCSLLCGS